jgi:hypothetical protein
VLYNTLRFDRLVYSNNSGAVLMISNCAEAYSGEFLGYWSAACFRRRVLSEDEAAEDAAARRIAIRYARDHARQLAAPVRPGGGPAGR